MHSLLFLLTLAADLTPQPVSPLPGPTLHLGFEASQSPAIAFHRQAFVAIFPTHLRLQSVGVDVFFRNANANPSASFNSSLPGLIREYPLGQPQPHYPSIDLQNLYPGFLTQFTYSPSGQITWRFTCQAAPCNWSALEFEVPTATSVSLSGGSLSAPLSQGRLGPVLRLPPPGQGTFTSKGPRSFGIEPGPNHAFEVQLSQFFPLAGNSMNFASFILPDPLDKPAPYPAAPYRGCHWTIGTTAACADPALARFSSDGELLWLTVLHGSRAEILDSFVTTPTGALYLSGRTDSSDFPTTPGAFQTRYAHPPSTSLPTSESNLPTDLFLARFQPADGTLLASTLIGGPSVEDRVIVRPASDGSLFLLPRDFGLTRPGTPTTAGAFAPTCPDPCGSRWAGRISSDLSRLIYGTYLLPGSTAYHAHSDHSLYFVGYNADPARTGTAYLARLDATGQRLLFDTSLNPNSASTHALAVAADGTAWVSVSERDSLRRTVELLAADGSRVLTEIPIRSSVLATDALGRLHAIEGGEEGTRRCGLRYVVYGREGTLIHSLPIPGAPTYRFEAALPTPRLFLDEVLHLLDPNYTPPLVLSCIASATKFQHVEVVAPGMLLTLFGEGLGPTGTRVFLNGWEAPVLYTSPTQVNIAVPFELPTGQPVDFEVQASGLPSRTLRVNRVESSNVQLFPVVLNQDGSVNSASNPAARDSIVILWGTGAGNTNPPSTTGEILPLAPRPLANPIQVRTIGEVNHEVLYAGAAPGLIAGLTQINVRLSRNSLEDQVQLTVATGASSASVSVFVKPE